jgi:hypothetical protein
VRAIPWWYRGDRSPARMMAGIAMKGCTGDEVEECWLVLGGQRWWWIRGAAGRSRPETPARRWSFNQELETQLAADDIIKG